MSAACPHLPEPPAAMDWRDLHAHRGESGEALYLNALRYGQYLWVRRLPARALLAVDRALYADLRGDEPALARHPIPYAAIGWLVRHAPPGEFAGNARVHYQHLADRVAGPRAGIKRWRAWAAWAVVRRCRPELPADPKHAVVEPSEAEIAAELLARGLPGEVATWRAALAEAAAAADA